METKIKIKAVGFDKNGVGNAYLVRGIGKRAILVVLRPAFTKIGYDDPDCIVLLAARYAAHKGWKVIYAEPDQIDLESVRVFNSHQFFCEANLHGYFGDYLCMCDVGEYNIFNDPEFIADCLAEFC